MIRARIYATTKSAMQSGHACQGTWTLIVLGTPGSIRDLETAWNSTADTLRQIKLTFDSFAEAKAYADRHHLCYVVDDAKVASARRRTYAENFRRH